jgi:hypothetical protein
MEKGKTAIRYSAEIRSRAVRTLSRSDTQPTTRGRAHPAPARERLDAGPHRHTDAGLSNEPLSTAYG